MDRQQQLDWCEKEGEIENGPFVGSVVKHEVMCIPFASRRKLKFVWVHHYC